MVNYHFSWLFLRRNFMKCGNNSFEYSLYYYEFFHRIKEI